MTLLVVSVLLLYGCKKSNATTVEKAFYYWKSAYYDGFGHAEDSVLHAQKAQKVYIKFFEVRRDETLGNIPEAKTQLMFYDSSWSKPDMFDSISFVPSIFIRNEVFLKSSHTEIDTLAANVNFLIEKFCREKFKNRKPNEYQIDCDWTPKSRDNYFYFLNRLKATSNKTLSCTLRLYPYKYPEKMGVPPVDKAMLMCYNLIGPFDNQDKNSVLDNDELASYLNTDNKYPMHLDIALPIFSWAHVYHNDRFNSLIYPGQGIVSAVLKPTKPLWYEVQKDTVVDGVYLRIGDKVKYEQITAEKVNHAIEIIKKYVPLDNKVTVTLFHLDQNTATDYTNEQIARFYSDLGN